MEGQGLPLRILVATLLAGLTYIILTLFRNVDQAPKWLRTLVMGRMQTRMNIDQTGVRFGDLMGYQIDQWLSNDPSSKCKYICTHEFSRLGSSAVMDGGAFRVIDYLNQSSVIVTQLMDPRSKMLVEGAPRAINRWGEN
eukprot:gene10274-8196_t